MGLKISNKHLQIDKANRTIVILLSVAVFVTIFSIFATRALLSKRAYQSRVISGKEEALKQLKSNVAAVESLNSSYQSFVNTPQNVIGGSPTGTGSRDGDNARIVLDALPSKYDFPALTTSLEKILSDKNYTINSIAGVDDEVAQTGGGDMPVDTAAGPVPIPFTISINGTYDSMQGLISTLEQSIRPIQLTSLKLTANSTDVQMDVSANTYYQAEKIYTVTTKDVK